MHLGINTAIQPYSIGIIDSNNTIIHELSLHASHSWTENLAYEIESILKTHNKTLQDLSSIGVTQGPGQYTGLRIGITLAKTLSQTLNIPVYGISTLESLVYPFRHNKAVYLTAIPSRKNEFNIAIITTNGKTVSRVNHIDLPKTEKKLLLALQQDQVISIEEFQDIIKSIHDSIIVIGQCSNDLSHIKADIKGTTLAYMAKEKYDNQEAYELISLNPKYSHNV